jgi:hypothetical protein
VIKIGNRLQGDFSGELSDLVATGNPIVKRVGAVARFGSTPPEAGAGTSFVPSISQILW